MSCLRGRPPCPVLRRDEGCMGAIGVGVEESFPLPKRREVWTGHAGLGPSPGRT
jgi:hypothetical protein